MDGNVLALEYGRVRQHRLNIYELRYDPAERERYQYIIGAIWLDSFAELDKPETMTYWLNYPALRLTIRCKSIAAAKRKMSVIWKRQHPKAKKAVRHNSD